MVPKNLLKNIYFLMIKYQINYFLIRWLLI